MKIVKEVITNEIIIEKSRFITLLKRVNSVEEAAEILASTQKKHYDANHNCYAYIIGQNAEIMKSSDDGEPSKTAGFPILDALKKNNITNTICIVTRYFGGIKLGTGGLTRAYSNSSVEAIKKANFIEIRVLKCYLISLSYPLHNQANSLLLEKSQILETTFSDCVSYKIATQEESLIDEIINLSQGKAIINYLGTINCDFDVV